MDEGERVPPCAVTFWTFAGPVLIGNMAMLGVGLLVDAYAGGESTTKKTAATFVKFSAFWLAAGLSWIAFNRQNGAATT